MLTFPIILTNGSVPFPNKRSLAGDSVHSVLDTTINHIPFMRTMGNRLSELLGEPNDIILMNLARVYIAEALSKWCTNIKPLDTSFIRTTSGISIKITYTLAGDNTEQFIEKSLS